MANTFEFTDWLSMKGLQLLTNKLQVAQFFNTDYNSEYTKEFPVGETVRIPLPQRFTVRDGLGYSPQPINRIHTTVAVDQIFGVDFEWDSAEAALKLSRGREKIEKEYLEPAMAQLAQEWDSRCALWATNNTNNIVGVLGTDPTTLTVPAQARQRMFELACPQDEMPGLIVAPSVNTSLVPAFATYFQPGDAISRQYKKGTIGIAQNFKWYESMSLYSTTASTWAGTVEMLAGGQSGSSLSLTATNSDTFTAGDVVNIAGVYDVNPMTRRKTGHLKNFVLTQSTVAASSAATIQVQPALVGPGSQYQNVDSLPVAGADLTLYPGTTTPNGKSGINSLAIYRDAFALVGVKLELPKAVEMASQTRDPDTGMALRFTRTWDPVQSKMINRFDTMGGFGNLYADSCAVRMLGQ